MNPSHLSDEAVAAFADGVLRGHARSRAARHVDMCQECRQAVRAQREAVWALRQAPAPALPAGLFERLQGLPAATPVPPPLATQPHDGGTLFAALAPMAAFAPQHGHSAPDEDDDRDARVAEATVRTAGLAALFAARARRRG